jgi:hypothetical protein
MKAGSLRDRSHLELFEFAGKMLGKALYEVRCCCTRWFNDNDVHLTLIVG